MLFSSDNIYSFDQATLTTLHRSQCALAWAWRPNSIKDKQNTNSHFRVFDEASSHALLEAVSVALADGHNVVSVPTLTGVTRIRISRRPPTPMSSDISDEEGSAAPETSHSESPTANMDHWEEDCLGAESDVLTFSSVETHPDGSTPRYVYHPISLYWSYTCTKVDPCATNRVVPFPRHVQWQLERAYHMGKESVEIQVPSATSVAETAHKSTAPIFSSTPSTPLTPAHIPMTPMRDARAPVSWSVDLGKWMALLPNGATRQILRSSNADVVSPNTASSRAVAVTEVSSTPIGVAISEHPTLRGALPRGAGRSLCVKVLAVRHPTQYDRVETEVLRVRRDRGDDCGGLNLLPVGCPEPIATMAPLAGRTDGEEVEPAKSLAQVLVDDGAIQPLRSDVNEVLLWYLKGDGVAADDAPLALYDTLDEALRPLWSGAKTMVDIILARVCLGKVHRVTQQTSVAEVLACVSTLTTSAFAQPSSCTSGWLQQIRREYDSVFVEKQDNVCVDEETLPERLWLVPSSEAQVHPEYVVRVTVSNASPETHNK
eukprot:PhM_4_TR14527/c0_g1_i1/m.54024